MIESKEPGMLLIAKQVAHLLQCKPHSVAQYVKRGYFQRFPQERRYRYKLTNIEAYLASTKQVGNNGVNHDVI